MRLPIAVVVVLAAWFISLSTTISCGGNAPAASTPAVSAVRWSEADELFQSDPRWLGADAAFTVALGGDRILWLFGDSFVATSAANVRTESKLIRNSVAVQTGADPTAAAMTFHWRTDATATPATPASFFPEQGSHWSWPLHGLRVDNTLVLFLSDVMAAPGQGLGFQTAGWRAAVINNPDDSPDQWAPTFPTVPPTPAGLVIGGAAVRDGDFVIALAIREPGDHAGYLARWPTATLAAGQLDGVEWWTGAGGWTASGTPAQVLDDAGAECSFHRDARSGKWMHVASAGFGATTVTVRFADATTGPWSAPRDVFRPAESDRPNTFVYAAKGHPELSGADLVVTYASNTFAGFDALLADTSIYFPRFVKLTIDPP